MTLIKEKPVENRLANQGNIRRKQPSTALFGGGGIFWAVREAPGGWQRLAAGWGGGRFGAGGGDGGAGFFFA